MSSYIYVSVFFIFLSRIVVKLEAGNNLFCLLFGFINKFLWAQLNAHQETITRIICIVMSRHAFGINNSEFISENRAPQVLYYFFFGGTPNMSPKFAYKIGFMIYGLLFFATKRLVLAKDAFIG